MKWTILIGIIGLTSGCCTTGVIAYQQVSVVPINRVVPVVTQVKMVPVRQVVTRVITPIVEPVLVDYVEPIDVTTTSIDFY
jgi:hypothetical protein